MIIWFNHPDVKSLAKTLPKQGIEIGCNFFYRVRSVDHICAFDWRTRDKITADTKDTKNFFFTFWTRNGFKTTQFDEVVTPLRLQPVDSGTMAIYLAIKYLKAKQVTVLGCGWHRPETTSLFDDCYSHRKDASKVSNPKLKLLRTYQDEFKTPIRFVADAPISPYFDLVRVEDL
jgi:hypothetical protein